MSNPASNSSSLPTGVQETSFHLTSTGVGLTAAIVALIVGILAFIATRHNTNESMKVQIKNNEATLATQRELNERSLGTQRQMTHDARLWDARAQAYSTILELNRQINQRTSTRVGISVINELRSKCFALLEEWNPTRNSVNAFAGDEVVAVYRNYTRAFRQYVRALQA